jgi:hypothetical protein
MPQVKVHVDNCFLALLFKAKSLDIFHPFKSSFTIFFMSTLAFSYLFFCYLFYVNFGFLLSLYPLLSCRRIPQCTAASGGLCWTCPNHLNWCWTNFYSIGATPILWYIIIVLDPIPSYVATNLTQHTHFRKNFCWTELFIATLWNNLSYFCALLILQLQLILFCCTILIFAGSISKFCLYSCILIKSNLTS